MSAGRLVVWRHGQTAWNRVRRGQGQLDVPLDDVGRAQAAGAAARLAALEPTAIVCSDLGRCVQTAGYLAERTGLAVSYDPDLREIDLGGWSGLLYTEVAARFPAEQARLRAGHDVRRGGTGESEAMVAARVAPALRRAAASVRDGATVVVCSHGLATRVGVCALVGLPPGQWHVLGGLANCAWVVCEPRTHGPAPLGWRIVEWNAGSLPEPVLGDDVGEASGAAVAGDGASRDGATGDGAARAATGAAAVARR